MSGRGGARPRSGRKSKLTKLQALMVGERYEALWLKAATDQAMARYERDTTTKMVRQEQARADLIPTRGRRMNEDITESIDEIICGRRVSIPVFRPYGVKAEIVSKVVGWCKDEYEQIITPSKANECWKEYRRFQKWAKNKRSLNST